MKAEICSAFYRIAIDGMHIVTYQRGAIVEGRTADAAVRAGCAQWLHDLEKKIKKTKMPKVVKKEAKKQLSRMEMMHPDSSEAGIIRTYLDWLVEVPWSRGSR